LKISHKPKNSSKDLKIPPKCPEVFAILSAK
jgi:hypothetical protein